MFDRVLNMPRVLNMLWFYIYQSFEHARVTHIGAFKEGGTRVATAPDQTHLAAKRDPAPKKIKGRFSDFK